MNELLFQKMFDELQVYLPKGWVSLSFFALYEPDSYNMKFYVKDSEGMITDCFSLENVNDEQLHKSFDKIDKMLLKSRKGLKSEELWSSITIQVNHDGKLEVNLDYNSIDDEIEYIFSWKEKYLK